MAIADHRSKVSRQTLYDVCTTAAYPNQIPLSDVRAFHNMHSQPWKGRGCVLLTIAQNGHESVVDTSTNGYEREEVERTHHRPDGDEQIMTIPRKYSQTV